MSLIFHLQCFHVIDIFRGDWDIEIFDVSERGQIENSSFFFLNLTNKPEKSSISGIVYESNSTSYELESLPQINIDKSFFELTFNFEQPQDGNLFIECINDGVLINVSDTIPFNFTTSFDNYLYASGSFLLNNIECVYIIHIINLAIIHITLSSIHGSLSPLNKEIILTRCFDSEVIPWYQKYNILQGCISFAVTFTLLFYLEPKIRNCFKKEEQRTRAMYDAAKGYFDKNEKKKTN